MILLFHCQYFRVEFTSYGEYENKVDDEVLFYKIIMQITDLVIFYISVSFILED